MRASVSPLLMLAGIMIASLGNSCGSREGSEGLRPACLPIAQHFSGLNPSSHRLLAQISFTTPPTIPSPAALFLYQAEQPLRHSVLQWLKWLPPLFPGLRGLGPSLERRVAGRSCDMDGSCQACLGALRPWAPAGAEPRVLLRPPVLQARLFTDRRLPRRVLWLSLGCPVTG